MRSKEKLNLILVFLLCTISIATVSASDLNGFADIQVGNFIDATSAVPTAASQTWNMFQPDIPDISNNPPGTSNFNPGSGIPDNQFFNPAITVIPTAITNSTFSPRSDFLIPAPMDQNKDPGSNTSPSQFIGDAVSNPFISREFSGVGTGQLSAWSEYPSISADGTTIAYITTADNPQPGDQRPGKVYAYDRTTGKSRIVSVDPQGIPMEKVYAYTALSGDGRYVAFCAYGSDAHNNGLLMHDLQTGKTTLIPSQGTPSDPVFSADGRFLAFTSGDDVVVYDMDTGKTVRASVASDGTGANARSFWPSLSGDGRYIVFMSEATNLAPVKDGTWNVFLHDIQTGTTDCVSYINDDIGRGAGDPPVISEDGRYIAFGSSAVYPKGDGFFNTTDANIYVLDLQTGKKTRIAYGPDEKGHDFTDGASISADGRYVAFHKDFHPPDGSRDLGQVFVRDMVTGETVCVSVSSSGETGNSASHSAMISSDGRFVVFNSVASNLVPGDTNRLPDVFLHDLKTKETIRVSIPAS